MGGDRWWHFWRSFNECHRDGFYPTRFHVVGGKDESTIIHKGKIYHMGYAQSEAITAYKIRAVMVIRILKVHGLNING